MLFVLFALWLISLLLLLIDVRSATMRWMSAVAFTGGIGALAAVIDADLLPYVQTQTNHAALLAALYRLQAFSSLTSYYGLPYSFIMLALAYNPVWPTGKLRRALPYALLLPAAACLLFTPGYSVETPITFSVAAWWTVPYIIAGATLIALKKERLPALQRTHFYTCAALLPPVICFAFLNYMMPVFGYYRMWVYNTWVLAVIVPFFIFILFKYGFLGMRLLIQRRKLDSTLRAITSGTAILNHAIKNDVGKMRLFCEKIKQYAEETNQLELLEDVNVVLGASEHIRDLVSRVHEQTQELPLKPEPVQIKQLILDVAAELQPQLSSIRLQHSLPDDTVLRMDRAQVSETVTNVLMNAIEAMPQGGELTVKAFAAKKQFVLEIRDTGSGMDKAVLGQVLEPFYTTKSGSRNNFGLGLAYCYSIMKKHGGSLELKSEPGQGTSVFLSFPGSAVLPSSTASEDQHGAYQTAHRRG